jgi:hypothetical protein
MHVNIRIHNEERGCEHVNWSEVAKSRLQWRTLAVMVLTLRFLHVTS